MLIFLPLIFGDFEVFLPLSFGEFSGGFCKCSPEPSQWFREEKIWTKFSDENEWKDWENLGRYEGNIRCEQIDCSSSSQFLPDPKALKVIFGRPCNACNLKYFIFSRGGPDLTPSSVRYPVAHKIAAFKYSSFQSKIEWNPTFHSRQIRPPVETSHEYPRQTSGIETGSAGKKKIQLSPILVGAPSGRHTKNCPHKRPQTVWEDQKQNVL